MTSRSLHLQLEMISDWRIGTGTGRQGSIDGVVARDRNKLPYVPATTLRGMWRDAAEHLAFGLDNGTSGLWTIATSILFGSQPADLRDPRPSSPISGLLSVTDARFPDALGAAVADKPRVREAFTFIKSGVAIDPESGRAKDDFLRFDEIARAGARLDAEATIAESTVDGLDPILRHFAVAALRLVERIGGDRRRGAGRCRIGIYKTSSPDRPDANEVPINDAIKALTEAGSEALEPFRDVLSAWSSPVGAGDIAFADRPVGRAQVIRIPVKVTITAPTTIADKVEGNVISTRDHIGGTLLIPAILDLLANSAGVMTRDAALAAISSGRIRVLPAYPTTNDDRRAVPAPMVIEEEKGSKLSKLRLRPKPGDGDGEKKKKEQYKAVRSAYCSTELAGNTITFAAKAGKGLRTHNAVDDRFQKPTEDAGGGVYVNEALAVGAVFLSELVLLDGVVSGDDVGRITGKTTAHLGRKKATGQARAEVELLPPAERAGPAKATGSILFSSDVILPIGSIDAAVGVLEQLLRERGIVSKIDRQRSDVRFRRLDGWVGAWGLPRPTMIAVAAGSVLYFNKPDENKPDETAADPEAIVPETAADLEATGLGERRGEGFGDVLVGLPILERAAGFEFSGHAGPGDNAAERSHAKLATSGSPADWPKHLTKFLQVVEREAIRSLLRDLAELAASDGPFIERRFGWKSGVAPVPPMSQFGAIRSLIDATAESPTLTRAATYLGKVKEKSDRAEKWGGPGRVAAIIALLEASAGGGDAIWSVLARVDAPEPGRTPEAVQKLDEYLEGVTIVSDLAEIKRTFAARATVDFLLAAIRRHKRASERRTPTPSAPAVSET